MQLGLEVQSSPCGTRACALGSVPSVRVKPVPWYPSGPCIQHGAVVLGKPLRGLCFGIWLWIFQVVFEMVF